MGMFREKLCELVPVVKKTTQLLEPIGLKRQTASVEILPSGDFFELTYLQPVEKMWERCMDINGKRIFVVSNEESIAVKAALGTLLYPVYANREEIYSELEERGYQPDELRVMGEDGKLMNLNLIYLDGEKKSELGVGNPYFKYTAEVTHQDNVFFWGLDNNSSLQDKLDVMTACAASTQFVMLDREQVDEPWVRELMKEREYEILWIPETENEYFENILKTLLQDERYQLADNLSECQLIRLLRKKCGNSFSEEDIALGLDSAVKKVSCTERRYVLEKADFFMDMVDEISPMAKLQRMTGLTQMKNMAMQYAALSREQTRNPKLKQMCKHAIFQGNPGTGKTMCAKLLAQIIEENGQSNGCFVAAARKDIIGEYVGHTAPRIEKLFKWARNGVLFVDEAGFFLHNERNSFTQEAVKEFVRYMELYQDVTVIFALYPHEVEPWLQLDAGLASRIGRVIEFEDYSVEELIQIAESMCNSRGYKMAVGASTVIENYVCGLKKQNMKDFGNAREMRKLVEAAIVARSLRCYSHIPKEKEPILTVVDFENAIEGFLKEKRQQKEKMQLKKQIGFRVSERVAAHG